MMLSAAQKRHFAALGDALGVVRGGFEGPLPVAAQALDEDFLTQLGRLTSLLASAIERVTALVNGPLAAIAADDSSSESAMHRVAGRLQEALDELRRLRGQAANLGACDAETRARILLVGGCDHILHELRDWFDLILEALADPLGFARKRGMLVEGVIELPLALTLTAPPHIEELAEWLNRQTRLLRAACEDNESEGVPPARARIGFLGWVGIALAAWGLS